MRLQLLLPAVMVSRNPGQAALASYQNERQRFLLTGESDNNRDRRREARVSAGGKKACTSAKWGIWNRNEVYSGIYHVYTKYIPRGIYTGY
jgi:hypothetical protein